jgi:hypothetical protein
MPPFSYIVIAMVLAGLVAVSLALTQMYAIFLWYWIFAAAGCVFAVIGAFRILYGLGTSIWIGLALASPALFWAFEQIIALRASSANYIAILNYIRLGAFLATTIATIACVRLIEKVSFTNVFVRIAYGVLALGLALTSLGIVQTSLGATWYRNAAYMEFVRWVSWPILVTKYGVLIVAPIILAIRRNLEIWTLIPIVGIALLETYNATVIYFPSSWTVSASSPAIQGIWFWLKPVVFFIGGAAVWRMGSVLLSQRREQKVLAGVAAS